MSSMPSSDATIERNSNVIMGQQDFFSTLLRLTGGELYKIRRRLMSKILLIIGAVLILAVFSIITITYSVFSSFGGQTCTSDTPGPTVCQPVEPGTREAQQFETAKRTVSAALRLPDSLITGLGLLNPVGLVLLVILSGTIVGGEYGGGTVRLLLTRGPTRTQFLLAKMLAIVVCISGLAVIFALLGTLFGALYNLLTPYTVDWSFFSIEWLGHVALYVLILTLGLLVYNMLAVCLGTLGKASAAGIAGGLVWWFTEGILAGVCLLLAGINRGTWLGDFFAALPNYFIGNSLTSLLDNQKAFLIGNARGSISDTQALLTLLAYLVVLTGITWFVTQKRDITS